MNRRDDDYGALDDLLGPAEGWYEEPHDSARPDVPPEPTLALDRRTLVAPQQPPRSTERGGPRGRQRRLPLSPSVPPAAPTPSGPHRPRRPRALVGFAVLAVLLVLAAFGVGRLFAEEPRTAPADGAPGGAAGDGAPRGSSGSEDSGAAEGNAAYEGAVTDVQVAGSTASCQAPDSVDAGGNPTSYPSSHAHDGDTSTAWRCDGPGTGERLTITLARETTVAEVGLVPGYAKTDPVNGADRYAENNRITRVRWTFDDGSSYVQRMIGTAGDRSMRTRRIPRTATGSVVLEVLASARGPRNTIAVSEVRIAEPAG